MPCYNYIKCFVIYCILRLYLVQATTPELYPGWDTLEFDQGHMAKNQPIIVLVLLSESLGVKKLIFLIKITA